MDNSWYNGNKSNSCFNQQKIMFKDTKSKQGPKFDTNNILVTVKHKQKIKKISQKWNQEKLDNPGFTKKYREKRKHIEYVARGKKMMMRKVEKI
jgi:hypothetical protein